MIIHQTHELETLNLSGLPLVGFNIEALYGDYAIDFPIPNPTGRGTCDIDLGYGNFSGSSLLNSRFDRFHVTTISGAIRLGFDGLSLEQTLRARIQTKSGGIWLEIPATIPARIYCRIAGSAVVYAAAHFEQIDSTTYQTGGYHLAASPCLEIEIDTVIGDIRLIGR